MWKKYEKNVTRKCEKHVIWICRHSGFCKFINENGIISMSSCVWHGEANWLRAQTRSTQIWNMMIRWTSQGNHQENAGRQHHTVKPQGPHQISVWVCWHTLSPQLHKLVTGPKRFKETQSQNNTPRRRSSNTQNYLQTPATAHKVYSKMGRRCQVANTHIHTRAHTHSHR